MVIPADVLIHNQIMGLKGTEGKLLQISDLGYYEVECVFGKAPHRILLPIQSTVVIAKDAAEDVGLLLEIEP
jgi:hypothetical protein